ncbi:NmrA-like family domain-containing protein 1 [Rhizophagus clarus]|uniref:NmrA-like family domain-containing protein 1 n=1 Tax=Rhizophagus clarus TaxID=94130 RepID=A0A8H3MAI1_9GLOM|nr:NmrA-like family domain-containing protein 1 [Rhizophagus clarus]
MSQKPLVVVSGATGAQGGSVVNSLLATGLYKIRALTRNPDSDKSKALITKGVDEVVKCDFSNKEDVKNALNGADIAWIVTNFWDPSIVGANPSEEERQGKLIADVAKEVGLNWLIYSSLPDTTAESGGKYPDIVHFSENIQIPMVDVENDTGPIVAKIIEEGATKWNGKKISVAGEYVTLKHVVDVLTKVTGKTYKLKTLNDENLKEFSFLDNNELKQMHKWFVDYGLFGLDNEVKDISLAKKLHPKIKSFEQYARETFAKA